jgi:adenosylcobyric acid synthase
LPALSNGTDFRLLEWAEWIDAVPDGDVDFIVLPGTKSTIPDLMWLRTSGLAEWIAAQYRRGATVIGVCGGFQMLGRSVHDPGGVESDVRVAAGLGLLPCVTVLAAEKTTVVRHGTTASGTPFSGYEIHMGTTDFDSPPPPFARFAGGGDEGVRLPRLIGTYLHGALESPGVCAEIFGVEPRRVAAKTDHYDRLADWFDCHGRGWSALGVW